MNPPEWSPLDPTPTAGPVDEQKAKWLAQHMAMHDAFRAKFNVSEPDPTETAEDIRNCARRLARLK